MSPVLQDIYIVDINGELMENGQLPIGSVVLMSPRADQAITCFSLSAAPGAGRSCTATAAKDRQKTTNMPVNNGVAIRSEQRRQTVQCHYNTCNMGSTECHHQPLPVEVMVLW
ncbi:unnamed protein product [Soboliphyme baturini]|uniref:Uncharacterized protein n=1 Tax=Soboliphyme baturini TaxID=241478 RepID=A0A183IG10_9BILA|nr:unnamed protein product [Soboliphyme baturini]